MNEGFAVFDLFASSGTAKTFAPFTQDAVELLDLPFVLKVEGVVVIVVFSAGNQLLESFGPVFGKGEFFDESDTLLGMQAGLGKEEATEKGESTKAKGRSSHWFHGICR